MKRVNKFLSVFLALIMIFSIIPMSTVTASAEDVATSGTCGENLTWTFEESTSTLTISGTGAMSDVMDNTLSIVLPWAEYKDSIVTVNINEGVTELCIYAFYGCNNITSVSIPSSVTSIGAYAFAGCEKLESVIVDEKNQYFSNDENGVLFDKNKTMLIQYPRGSARTTYTIPNSVTTIGQLAFYSSSNLSNIIIPNSVSSIDHNAFYFCTGLTSITIPGSVRETGNMLFSGCKNLTNITLLEGITAIGDYTFSNCNISSIIIPNSVMSIGISAFYGCKGLTSVSIPDSVKSIGDYAFENCSSLTDITIGDGVTSIGRDAFNGTAYYNDANNWENNVLYIDKYLIDTKSVLTGDYNIKEGTRVIADFAFDECHSLTSVTIPESVVTVGLRAFNYCSKLTEIDVDRDNENYASIGGVLFNKSKTKLIQYPIGSTVEVYSFPDTVKVIGEWAFAYCSNLTKVKTLDGISTYGAGGDTYPGCTTLNLNKGLITIEEYAFYYCNGITELTIPDTVKTIEESAFSRCYAIRYILIGSGLETLGENVFSYCEHLRTITVDENNLFFSSDSCGVLFDKKKTKLLHFPQSNPTSHYVIPDSVIELCGATFYYCQDLISVTMGNGITEIPYSAFYCCVNLKSVTLSENITKIGSNAFYYCDNLKSISIPAGVTEIGDYAFYECKNLAVAILPEGLLKIGSYAFCYCESLTSISIPDSVTTIGSYAFAACTGVKSINIGSGITEIPYYAFGQCTSLTEINFPKSVTNVGNYAFYKCNQLKDVYYSGTEEQWNEITIGTNNEPLLKATVHFNSTGAHVHSYTIVVTPPTCAEPGYKTYTCDCGDIYTEEIPPCHSFSREWVDPSCEQPGYFLYTCSECDYAYITEDGMKEPLGHEITSQVIKPATHTENGLIMHSCSRCGKYGYEEIIANGDHQYTSVVTAPTCTEKGYTTYTCECGDSYDGDYVDATGHKYTSEVTKPATHTENGVRTYTCIYCPDSYTEVIPASGDDHSYTAVVTPPTCTKQGYTTYTCACGNSYVDNYVDATGHKYTSEVTKPATHTENGVMTHTCIRCSDSYTEVIPASGDDHSYTAVVTPPTCTKQGYTTYTCACGDSYIDDYVPTVEHTEKTITIPATCTVAGMSYTVCETCGDTIGDATVIPAKGHSHRVALEENYVAPTCTTAGSKDIVVYCSVCNAEVGRKTETIKELGHTSKTITIPATCTVAGMSYNVCEKCGDTIGDATVIPAKGHTHKAAVEENYVAPTCTTAGSKDMVVYCSVCNAEVSRKTESISALGHTAGDWKIALEPTYEADGLMVKKCTVCGVVVDEEIIPMLVKITVTDDDTGVSMEFDEGDYNGDVEIVVEESFDGAAFNIIDTSLDAVQSFVYDITMTVDGVTVQPNGKVTIRIPLPEGYDPNRSFVYHLDTTTGKAEKMPATYEDGYLIFETTHFSYYAVVEESNYSFSIQTPSRTEIRNKDGIILHAVVDGTAPTDSYVKWESSNGNFDEDADGSKLEIIAKNKGYTTFTAILCDADGNELARDSVEMYSKSGFFDKIGGFFRSLFGITKIYDK